MLGHPYEDYAIPAQRGWFMMHSYSGLGDTTVQWLNNSIFCVLAVHGDNFVNMWLKNTCILIIELRLSDL